MAGGDGDDLLDVALEHEGREEVEQVDVAGDVDLEVFREFLLKLVRTLAPVLRSFKSVKQCLVVHIFKTTCLRRGAHGRKGSW